MVPKPPTCDVFHPPRPLQVASALSPGRGGHTEVCRGQVPQRASSRAGFHPGLLTHHLGMGPEETRDGSR